jgi:hypothetical protein
MPSKKKSPVSKRLTGPAAARHGSLPMIALPGDNELQRAFNREAADLLKGKGLYRRDLMPVTPEENRLLEMKPANFISWSQQHFIGYKTKLSRDGDKYEVLRDMTEAIAKNTLQSHDFVRQMPMIHRVYPSPVPIINAADSLILCTPGYDPSTGTFVFEGKIQPEPPPAHRTVITGPVGSDDYFDDSITLGEAFWFLHELHRHFPFADWSEPIFPSEGDVLYREAADGTPLAYRQSRSLAVQIGAMLSLFAANCVPQEASKMGFIYNANAQRSGKSLLGKLATAPVYGTFKAQPWREDDEAMIKILDSEVIAASPYICFDNIRGLLQSQPLEGFMTSPTWTGRYLGRSEMFTAENNTLVLFTGNNVNAGTDIQHRTLWVNLFVEEADVQSRQIDGPVLNDVWLARTDNRRAILSALWSIVRHWDHAGRPDASGRVRLGFEDHGRIIGGMVEHAFFGDMLERPQLENAGDSEAEDLLTLVKQLHAMNRPDYVFQEIVHACWEHGLFGWNLHGKEEMIPVRDGRPAELTLRLNDQCNSRMGLLLARHTGERGHVHQFRDATNQIVRGRLSCRGKGRHRRFTFTLF